MGEDKYREKYIFKAIKKTMYVQSSQADQSRKHFVVYFLDGILGQISVVKRIERMESY